MKRLQLLIPVALVLVFSACRREISCESCPSVPKPLLTDTLPADYPFKNGYCDGSALGVSIPFHDSVRFSFTDILPRVFNWTCRYQATRQTRAVVLHGPQCMLPAATIFIFQMINHMPIAHY
jgi:hypothetical protein